MKHAWFREIVRVTCVAQHSSLGETPVGATLCEIVSGWFDPDHDVRGLPCFRWKYSLSVAGVNFCLSVSSPDFLEHTAKDDGSSKGSDDCSPANTPIKY